jgi:hypothetical protein
MALRNRYGLPRLAGGILGWAQGDEAGTGRMKYDRTVIAYHGCDTDTARRIAVGETSFQPSQNPYDWLGSGVYFWEYGIDRAWRWAEAKHPESPAVVGALVQLGQCFDLLDTRFTKDLADFARGFVPLLKSGGTRIPTNRGGPPDQKARFRDCAVMNWYLEAAEQEGRRYDTVRCAFSEGPPVYRGMEIRTESHIQLVVRDLGAIIGVFWPFEAPSPQGAHQTPV